MKTDFHRTYLIMYKTSLLQYLVLRGVDTVQYITPMFKKQYFKYLFTQEVQKETNTSKIEKGANK